MTDVSQRHLKIERHNIEQIMIIVPHAKAIEGLISFTLSLLYSYGMQSDVFAVPLSKSLRSMSKQDYLLLSHNDSPVTQLIIL